MFNAEGWMGFRPKSSAQNAPPELGRKKTQPKSWGWGGVRPILGGTKRAADLGRNVPHTLDLERKNKFQPISGGTKRAAELGRKKIYRS